MSQQIMIDSPWGAKIPVNPSPDAFEALGLSIRSNDPLLPSHGNGKFGPLVYVLGVGLTSGTSGRTVIWCKSDAEGKNQEEEAVFFYPEQFPELFKVE